jgi:WD40 repeat protein
LKGRALYIKCVKFDNKGLLAAASLDGTVRIWDTAKGKELIAVEHDDSVQSVAFSPDGKLLAVGAGKTVKLWEVAKLLGQK